MRRRKVRPLRQHILMLLIVMALASSGCGGGETQQAHGGGQGGERRRPPQPAIPVAIDKAKVGAIANHYTATATLAAENEAQILARVSGVVEALHCEEGDRVAAGQLLLSIVDDEFRFKLAQAEASNAILRSRGERMEGMREQGLISAEEYETAKNELIASEAEEKLAQLTLSYTRVTSPFRGVVVSRSVDVGQNVNVGTMMFVLSDFDPLLARVHVPAKEFKRLQPDQPVDLVLESNGQRMTGRIKLVSPVIDPSSGTIKVTIEIREYPEGVRPGDFAEVRIVTENRADRILVPKIAVVTEKGEQVVYVAADTTAERRVVEVGFEDDDSAEILDGISAGEPVVVKGQRSLKHGSTIKILDGGEEGSVANARPPEEKKEKKGPPKKRSGS